MYILSIDITTPDLFVSVLEDEKVLATVTEKAQRSHSVSLMCRIDEALSECSIQLKDTGLIAVTSGPGSYTGIRIGISTVKGLAEPSGIPCIGINTLDAISRGTDISNGYVCSVIDARNSNCFCSITRYADGSDGTTICRDFMSFDEVASMLAGIDDTLPVHVAGYYSDTFVSMTGSLDEDIRKRLVFTDSNVSAGAGRLAFAAFSSDPDKKKYTALDLRSNYMRDSKAERTKKI